MKLVNQIRESIVLVWLILWYLKDIKELVKQGIYEEDLQSGKIG